MPNKKILICDDDSEILEMLELTLGLFGYEVLTVNDSLKIFSAVAAYHPDKILLDLWMPVLSGEQVLQGLKGSEETRSIPVIVFSASEKGEEIARQFGADGFIAKPFDVEMLAQKLAS